MKRIVIVCGATLLAATASLAQSRPSTVDRPCAVSRRTVEQNGAVVLGTGGYTYDRFVRDAGFCARGETIEPVWVPSRDSAACFVGYRCKQSPSWDD